MTLRILSASLLLSLGALGAWAGTQTLGPPAMTPAPPAGFDPAAVPAAEKSPTPTVSPATSAGRWSAETQVTHGTGAAVGAVGRTLAVLPDGTRVIVWSGSGRGAKARISRSSDGLRWSEPQEIAGTSFVMSPNLGAAPDGTLHVVYGQRQGGLFTISSPDGGRTWRSPIQLSPPGTTPVRGQTVAVDTRGRVHVAWHVGDPGRTPDVRTTLFTTRSTDGGRSYAPVQQLGASVWGHSAFPRFLLTGASGDLVAIPWRGQTSAQDWDVYMAVSTDGGETFTERVAVGTQFKDWDPESWVDAAGTIHLSWFSIRGRGQGSTIDYARSTDRGATWSPAVTLSTEISRFPSFAPSPDGLSAWLIWKDERDFGSPGCTGRQRCADIIGALTSDGGRSWSTPELFTDLGQVEAKFPSVVTDADGKLLLMWSDRREPTEQIFYKERQPL